MNTHDQIPPSPRSNLFGAHRPSANPRIHALVKPYDRPASYNGPSSSGQNGNSSSPKSPTKTFPSTRPNIPKSLSSSNLGQMTRSGSETSLFSGIRSMLSRPLAWLATPSRSQQGQERAQGKKRDGGWDEEEPGTPTDNDRGLKRARRRSPSPPQPGEYAPQADQTTGRALTGFMLPPLPPDVNLRAKGKQSAPAIPPNFSRPLTSSKSMSYLDPPKAMLSPAKKRGTLTRSKRVDLTMEDEADEMEQDEKANGAWSPWDKSHPGRTRGSITPARYTPMRETGFPSGSPFRAPPSPLFAHQPSNLARSSTAPRLRRESTAASDVSMGGGSARGGSRALIANGHEDVRMSPGGAQREGSALDWYMQDKWQGGGSPSARAASVRLGSAAPSSSMPPIRKGQFVWDSEKGFVRENELKAGKSPVFPPDTRADIPEAPQQVHQNDAERILFALESMRKTPLTEARSSTSFASMPADLVGSSSRSIRKAINVPLATAQAGDTARQRREKERLGEDYNVMISPYGRRKAVERDQRDQRLERSRSEMDAEYRPSHSPSRSIGSRSDVSSHASTDMRSEASVTPSPAPTPRRSARNKRNETAEEPTPRAQKGRSKKAAPESTSEAPRRRGTRRGTADKGNSPPPPATEEAPPPPVPVITETAPSPKHSTTSTYQIRDDSGPREKSSLRARTEITKRTHTSAANSRAATPTTGRYSAREEDLPPMEELESVKIPMPSFSGITFTLPAATPPTAPSSTPTPAPVAAPAKTTLAVPGRPGPLSRLNSSRPRASSPLASGSIVAQPESPPESTNVAPPSKPDSSGFFSLGTSSTTPSNPPPLFTSIANDMRASKPKESTSLGLGKPSAPATNGGGVPDFFGKKATASTAPAPAPASTGFSFGLPTAGSTAKAAPAPSFNFAVTPTENGVAPGTSVFGGTPVVVPPESSAPAPAAPSAPTFSFAKPAETAAKPDEAAAPKPGGFSFSAPAKPAEPAKLATREPFTFGPGRPASAAPSSTPSLSTATTGGFNFGQPAAKPAEPAASSSTPASNPFGGTAPPATDASKSPPPANPFGGFFGKPAESAAPKPAAAAAPSSTFSFGAANPSTGFLFGGDVAKTNGTQPASSGFGKPPASPSAPAAPAFTFGAPATAAPAAPAAPVAPSTGFSFGAPATAAPAAPAAPAPSGGFGGGFGAGFGAPSATPAATAAPATPSTFNFGGPAASTGFGNGTPTNGGFGATPSAPAPPTTPGGFGSNTGFAFGQQSTTPAGTPSTFTFGAPAPSAPPTPAAASPFNFGGGAAPASPAQGFQFGAGPSVPSTPSAAPGAGGAFQFGAPQAQQGQVPRFGSPQPGDAGGFNMGLAGDTGPPGSPGRRQIKPLRSVRKR